jgi:hypothetical protein
MEKFSKGVFCSSVGIRPKGKSHTVEQFLFWLRWGSGRRPQGKRKKERNEKDYVPF